MNVYTLLQLIVTQPHGGEGGASLQKYLHECAYALIRAYANAFVLVKHSNDG